MSTEANSAFIRERRRYDEASPSEEQELMAYDFWLSTRGDRCLTAGIWEGSCQGFCVLSRRRYGPDDGMDTFRRVSLELWLITHSSIRDMKMSWTVCAVWMM